MKNSTMLGLPLATLLACCGGTPDAVQGETGTTDPVASTESALSPGYHNLMVHPSPRVSIDYVKSVEIDSPDPNGPGIRKCLNVQAGVWTGTGIVFAPNPLVGVLFNEFMHTNCRGMLYTKSAFLHPPGVDGLTNWWVAL